MNEEWSRFAANSIAHCAEMAQRSVEIAAAYYERPSVVYRPKVYIDRNKWCALYGDNLQDGVAGFGDSPAEAMDDFHKAWYKKLSSAHGIGEKPDAA